jgi:predicted DNA-binding protein
MNKTKLFDKAVSLNLPSTLCYKMDEITEELGMTRTAFLHQSIARNVEYMNKHELPMIRQRQRNYDTIISSEWSI